MSPGGDAKECGESGGCCCVRNVNITKGVVDLYLLEDA